MSEKKSDDKPVENKPDGKVAPKPEQPEPKPGRVEPRAGQRDEKAEAKAIAELDEKAVEPDNTEMPDHTAIRKAELHRQAEVGRLGPVDTGDDSSVNPQPDRDTVNQQVSFAPIPRGARQATEQPDRYAVNGADAEDTVEENSKNRRGRRAKKDDSPAGDAANASEWPAQYDGDGKEDLPAQYSY